MRRADDVSLEEELTKFMKFNNKNIQQTWSEELRSKLLKQKSMSRYKNKISEIRAINFIKEKHIEEQLKELKTREDEQFKELEEGIYSKEMLEKH